MTQASKAMIVQEPQQEQPRALVQHSHAEQAILTREGLKLAAEQRALLKEYIDGQMIKGTDYGTIPGTEHDTLYKPGAEKLVELFRCTPKFTLLKEKQDFDTGLFHYRFRCRLLQRDANVVLAEGYGSCNSRESRYRWRNANPKCPVCGKEALFRSKKDGEGFYCWTKKHGCGAQFPLNDAAVKAAFANAGKVENTDVADLDNTILKMAKKRALVDAAIALARVSDMFTQDAEDSQSPGSWSEHSDDGGTKTAPQQGAPAKKPASRKAQSKGLPIWQQAVVIATDYGFDCGAENKALWDLAAAVLAGKPAKDWTADDLGKLETELGEQVARRGQQPPPADDINF